MQSRKIKCEVVNIGSTFLLIAKDEPLGDGPVYSIPLEEWYASYETVFWPKNQAQKLARIIAINQHTEHLLYLPEYVIEAYMSGQREFEIEENIKTVEVKEFTYKQGLLEVSYTKPKRQTFTREEVLNMLKFFTSENFVGENWLDHYYK